MKPQPVHGLLGLAVGDALGVPVEFQSRARLKSKPVKEMFGHGTHNQPPGTWSDDSSLAFCLTESLCRGFDLEDMGKRFVKWMMDGYWTPHGRVFDIGNTTRESLFNLQSGVSPLKAGGKEKIHNGNGSLMRILPLAYYLKGKENIFEPAHQASCITHGHPISQICCGIYICFAISLLEGKSMKEAYQSTCNTCEDYYSNSPLSPEMPVFSRIFQGSLEKIPEDEISSSGYVLDTLEASLWCLLTSSSYSETTLKAVNLGGDTDTTGAVAGGLAGIYYGKEGIPSAWLELLVRRKDIEDLAQRFEESLSF